MDNIDCLKVEVIDSKKIAIFTSDNSIELDFNHINKITGCQRLVVRDDKLIRTYDLLFDGNNRPMLKKVEQIEQYSQNDVQYFFCKKSIAYEFLLKCASKELEFIFVLDALNKPHITYNELGKRILSTQGIINDSVYDIYFILKKGLRIPLNSFSGIEINAKDGSSWTKLHIHNEQIVLYEEVNDERKICYSPNMTMYSDTFDEPVKDTNSKIKLVVTKHLGSLYHVNLQNISPDGIKIIKPTKEKIKQLDFNITEAYDSIAGVEKLVKDLRKKR